MFRQISSLVCSLFLVFQLFVFVHAQQYAGATVANSYPTVPGSSIAFFNILDPNKKNATLINYVSLNSTGGALPPANVKRLVIIIHGANRDPGTYMSNGLSALNVANTPGVGFDNVQLLAPAFPNGDDKNAAYPYITGQGTNSSYSPCLVWQGAGWAGGYGNQYPVNRRNVSSYAVLDQIITYYSNKSLFPNINQIVVAGHSLGGQTVQRYAAIGNTLSTSVPISYWIGNPNAWLWFSDSHPLPSSACSIADNWFNGFSNFTGSGMLYGSSLVASGRSAALALYNSRNLRYARGLNDTGDDSSTCAPMTQGGNRNERFFAFIEQFPPSSSTTIDYMACGHDFVCMSQSQAGLSRLFLDNFNGDGKTAYDQGCPRVQAGDDPFPDPSCETTKPVADAGSYFGYQYIGCYTDQDPMTLSYTAYRGNTSSTISGCVQTCQAAGYSVAGVEYGNECYCDNNLSYASTGPLVETACGMPCPNNSSAICGDENRLSVFSRGNTTKSIVPVAPANVGNYSYLGCYTEATSGRALTSSSLTSSTMTVEMCASFCLSYRYFGVEYSTQCFCGNSLSTGAVNSTTSGCSMTCNGNNLELCGGPNYLNMYFSNTTANYNLSSSTTTSGTASSTASASTATATLLCPAFNGTTYTTPNGKGYMVMCSTDYNGGDLSSLSASSLDVCISACSTTSGCIALAYVSGSCYLKNVLNAGATNSAVSGAYLTFTPSANSSNLSSSSSQTLAPSSSTTSSSSLTTMTASYMNSSVLGTFSTSFSSSTSTTASSSVMLPTTSSGSTSKTNTTTIGPTSSMTNSILSNTTSGTFPSSTSSSTKSGPISSITSSNSATLSSIPTSSISSSSISPSTSNSSSTVSSATISSSTLSSSTLSSSTLSSSTLSSSTFSSSTFSSSTLSSSTSSSSVSSSSTSTSTTTTSSTSTSSVTTSSSSAPGSTSFSTSSTSTFITSSISSLTSLSTSSITSSTSSSTSLTSKISTTSSSIQTSATSSGTPTSSSILTSPVSTSTLISSSSTSSSSTSSSSTSSSSTSSSSTSITSTISSSTSTLTSSSTTTSTSTFTFTTTPTTTSISTFLTSTKSTTTSTSITTTTTSSSTAISTTLPTCPSSNNAFYMPPNTPGNQIFKVQCYTDHNGGDFAMSFTSSFGDCVAACAKTWPCVAVSWVPGGVMGPCYMKNKVVTGVSPAVVWGAVWAGNGTISGN